MRIMVFIIYRKPVYYDPDAAAPVLSGKDITESDQIKYIEDMRQTARHSGILILAMIILEVFFAASYMIWGRIFLGLITFAAAMYLLFLGKNYRWVFPIGVIVCGGAAFISLLEGVTAPAALPDFILELTSTLFYISVPIQILMGLFFMYSKRITAHINFIEHTKIYKSEKE